MFVSFGAADARVAMPTAAASAITATSSAPTTQRFLIRSPPTLSIRGVRADSDRTRVGWLPLFGRRPADEHALGEHDAAVERQAEQRGDEDPGPGLDGV